MNVIIASLLLSSLVLSEGQGTSISQTKMTTVGLVIIGLLLGNPGAPGAPGAPGGWAQG